MAGGMSELPQVDTRLPEHGQAPGIFEMNVCFWRSTKGTACGIKEPRSFTVMSRETTCNACRMALTRIYGHFWPEKKKKLTKTTDSE